LTPLRFHHTTRQNAPDFFSIRSVAPAFFPVLFPRASLLTVLSLPLISPHLTMNRNVRTTASTSTCPLHLPPPLLLHSSPLTTILAAVSFVCVVLVDPILITNNNDNTNNAMRPNSKPIPTDAPIPDPYANDIHSTYTWARTYSSWITSLYRDVYVYVAGSRTCTRT